MYEISYRIPIVQNEDEMKIKVEKYHIFLKSQVVKEGTGRRKREICSKQMFKNTLTSSLKLIHL